MFDAYHNVWVNDREVDRGHVSTFDVSGPVPRRVFIKTFKYRCSCCGDLEAMEGLDYLSYEEPKQHEKILLDRSRHNIRSRFSAPIEWHYGHDMYFPNARCLRCIAETGKVISCIQLVPMKKTPHSVEKAEQGEKEIRDHITYRRSCLPEPSLPWPIDAPNWCMTQDAKARFTEKFMGLAFFVCPCRNSPVTSYDSRLTDKQLFYRCPFDEVREEYHPANVIRVLSSRELEDKYGE
jgi:hypothetical protein